MLSAFVSLAAFVVQEADARGGRGGGGGGGRGGGGFSRGGSSSMSRGGGGSYSRGGSMSRGSSSMSRGSYSRGGSGGSGFSRGGSYSRPGGGSYSPPSTGNRMASTRPGTGRPGQAGGGAQRPSQRPGQGGSGTQRPGRGDRTNIGGGDRNTNIGSGNTFNRNTNIDVDGGNWGGNWNGWGDYPIGAGIAIGAVAGMTAMAYGSAYYALPGGCSPYPYHSYTYYSCGGAYYQPQYEGDTVVYVTVPDPTTVTVQP